MPANSVIDSPMPAELDIDDKAQVIHIDNPLQDEDAIENGLNGTTILKPHLGLIATVRAYPKVTFLCFISALSAISDGYQINLSGSIIAVPGFIDQFGFPTGANGAMVLNPNHVSLFGTVKVLFTGVGAALGTWPSDRFGRKPMILTIQIVLACGTILEMFSTTWAHWVGARTIEGFGNGLNISVTSVYIAELAPTDGRGALIAFYAVWALPPSLWRCAIWSNWAFTGTACLLWILLPETPRYYCQKGREADTKRVLTRLYGETPGYDVDAEYIMLEREVYDRAQANEERKAGSYAELSKQPNLITLGVPIVLSYSAYFFKLAGLKNPFIGTLGVNVAASMFILERVGRRMPLLVGGAICVICVICIGGTLKSTGSGVGNGLIALACIWCCSFSIGNAPLVYTYASEVATVRLRAKTTGVAMGIVNCSQIAWMYATPVMLNSPNVGLSNTAFVYAAAGGIIWFLNFFFTPEIKGRTFEELDELFDRRVPTWKFPATETKVDIARKEQAGRGQV
ncbi:hypothetical protein EHS25_003914 [Saitozyma podzolica]|uniref:Major facilitator superfamily (MFS) profile domain-containing protein n=1 Tax=Saitozyma podzolica TaxID=1890683 RepID=A0A427Y3W4_9TREE|nr:hypothetical protein EHS25_003914 [Saitozyma podzolica]